MKLRWPITSYQCDDCGHTIRHWQTPWYKPRPRGPLSTYVDSLSPGIFSKDAVIQIGYRRIEARSVYDPLRFADSMSETYDEGVT